MLLEGHRTRGVGVGAGEEGDDGVRWRDRLDVFHGIVLEVVVADFHGLRGPWDGAIRVLRVGDIVCRRRGDRGVLDVLWPRPRWERGGEEGGVAGGRGRCGGGWGGARGNKEIAGHVRRCRRVWGTDVGEDARESCEGLVVV